MEDKSKIQNDQYKFPYHHVVDLENFSNYESWTFGIEYFNNMNFAIRRIKGIDFDSLLDIGCGDGRLIFELKKIFHGRGKRMVGADLSEQAIMFAKAFNYGNGSDFFCTDAKNIEGKFDLITLIEVLEHVRDEDLKQLAGSIEDKLAEGGHILISVPSDNSPITHKHFRHFNIELIKKTFANSEIVESCFLNKKSFYLFFTHLSNSIKIKAYQRFISRMAEKFFFRGSEKDCINISCLLKKKTKH
jgi:2-polyprenyl-3-methyl-5-hydroxy-6-metoxy-1,4-benzoquinol methylase